MTQIKEFTGSRSVPHGPKKLRAEVPLGPEFDFHQRGQELEIFLVFVFVMEPDEVLQG